MSAPYMTNPPPFPSKDSLHSSPGAGPWIPPRPPSLAPHPSSAQSSPGASPSLPPQSFLHPNRSASSVASSIASNQSTTPHNPNPTRLSQMSTGTVGVKSRKMTVGSSPLAQVTPLMPPGPIRKAPKPGMPSSLPPESVCECFLCHDLSPYSQNPPPEIPEYQRQDLARLGPTCPSIHLFCLASRLPMSLPLDTTQKTPLARTILDYFYSTWLTNDQGSRGSSNNLADLGMSSSISSSTSYPRVQCINFIPIHPLTASGFDRYLESLPWSKRVCRPLWMAADVRCKLGMEGMYRNCMQDKCQACFIFNDGFEDTLAKNKLIYLAPHSSRVHEKSVDQQRHNAAVSGTTSFRRKKSQSAAEDPLQYDDSSNMIRCMVLTFAALGCTFEVGPMEAYDGPERLKRPPKGFDIVRREYDLDDRSKVEYGVFAADAVVPLAMVLYKVF